MTFLSRLSLPGFLHDRFEVIPCDDFADLDEYIEYLGSAGKCPGFSQEINGGAQFMRMIYEIEVYFRFIEINSNLTEREVIQSRGVSTGDVSWMDSIVKLMRMHAPAKTRRAVAYVNERIKWFFRNQKEATLEFMCTIGTTGDSHLFSRWLAEKGNLIRSNKTVKSLTF